MQTQTYTLNTANKDALTFRTEEIAYTILGGINANHLDRMRVTLKIEVLNRKYPDFMNDAELAGIAVRTSVDLYQDIQVEKLVRRTAHKLEIGTTQLYSGLAQLTEQLEKHRLSEIEKQNNHSTQAKPLTEEQREAALAFLKSDTLNTDTLKLIRTSGIVGEENNALIMYYVFTSRKIPRPLHIVSFGSSGTGKSHLQEKVAELIPDEDKIEITSLTQNAFYYFGTDELGHKLILIEDLDGTLSALYPIRELQSKQRISKTLSIKDSKGNTKTIHLKVQGPVSVAGCTTQEQLYEDNANRSFLIYLDESKEQDEKIMQYQRLLSAGKINFTEENKAKLLLQNVQRLLKPVRVINPFAEYLQLPCEVFKPRRTNAHYLAFIEAVTFYHQYQRKEHCDEETGEVYIESTLNDIEIANQLMKEILLRKSDELNKATRSYFEQLKTWLKKEEKTAFTLSEARQALNVTHGSQKRYMSLLVQEYYIKKTKTKESYVYQISSYEDYKHIKQSVENALDNTLQQVKEQAAKTDVKKASTVHSSNTVQVANEPLKAAAIKVNRAKNGQFTQKKIIQP